MSSGRRPGLGSLSTRTREEARAAAGRIGADQTIDADRANTPPGLAAVAAPTVSAVVPAGADDAYGPAEDDNDDDDDDDDRREAGEEQQPPPQRAPRVSSRGRSNKRAVPTSLTPSRVTLQRIQIGPRLKPAIKDQFDDYCRALAKMGYTQSDLVESALVEYMERYPAETLRAALQSENH